MRQAEIGQKRTFARYRSRLRKSALGFEVSRNSLRQLQARCLESANVFQTFQAAAFDDTKELEAMIRARYEPGHGVGGERESEGENLPSEMVLVDGAPPFHAHRPLWDGGCHIRPC